MKKPKRKSYPKYETCDLMHNGVCVAKWCVRKSMAMAQSKRQKAKDRLEKLTTK